MMYDYYNYGMFFPTHSFFGFLFMILFAVLFVWVVIALMKHNSDTPKTGEGDTALRILKERYAKGEITKEQFESMKKDIQ